MPESTPQNAAIFLRPLMHHLERQGVSAEALMKQHGISLERLSDPGYRIPSARTHALLDQAEQTLGEPSLGISMARHSEYSAFGGLGLALAAGGNIRAVLTRITRFHGLLSDVIVSRLHNEGGELGIVFERRGEHEPHPQAIIFVMASIVRMLRFRLDRGLNPLSITVPSSLDDRRRDALRRYFRCPVKASDDYRLSFPGASSGDQLDASDTELAALLESTLSRRLVRQDNTPLGMRLALWLEDRLPEGEPSLAEAADAFHTSGRSLQRKLKAEESSFQKVIEDTRRALVERHLMSPGMSLTQLTFLLGFADVSSFSRAFRKWYGVAPSRYREQLREKGSGV